MLILNWKDISGLKRLENALARLDGPQKHMALQRAVNHTGTKALTAVTRVLSKQTGLPYGVTKKALKVNKASGGRIREGEISIKTDANLSFVITSRGGDISLKYFKARETREGVTAAPRGQRQLFPGTFIRGGLFPGRVKANGLHGHVWKRVGGARIPLKMQDSDVYIPEEMVRGNSAKTFTDIVEAELPKRVVHEIEYLAPGIFD